MSENNNSQNDSATTETNIDYSNEVDNLSEGGDGGGNRKLCKLPQGRTKLRFLSDGNVEKFNYGTEDKPDIQEKVVFPIEVVDGSVIYRDGDDEVEAEPGHDEELHYPVTRGKTKDSQWGMLARVGADRGGLDQEEVTIIRSGTGTGTSYVVEDALELED